MLKTPLSIFAVKILAPTLLVVAILGVFLVFFQGLGTMMPSAVSQIIEQIINAIVSVWAAYYLYSYGAKIGGVLGNKENYGAAYGAAGGTLGTNLGALSALLFLVFLFFVYRAVFKRQMRRERGARTEAYPHIFRALLFTIVPVLLSTTIYNISSILDQGVFKNIVLLQGYAEDHIPSLTGAFASRDMRSVKSQINSSIRFIMVIAFPCTVGIGVLASPILQLLFHDARELPANMLRVGAVAILFYSLSTLSNGLLQGINRMKVPVRNAAVALVAHIIFLLALLYGFKLNIYAVVYANAFFAFLMCVLNGYALKKYSGYNQEIKKTFVIPAIAALIMGVAAGLCYKGVYAVLKMNAVYTPL